MSYFSLFIFRLISSPISRSEIPPAFRERGAHALVRKLVISPCAVSTVNLPALPAAQTPISRGREYSTRAPCACRVNRRAANELRTPQSAPAARREQTPRSEPPNPAPIPASPAHPPTQCITAPCSFVVRAGRHCGAGTMQSERRVSRGSARTSGVPVNFARGLTGSLSRNYAIGRAPPSRRLTVWPVREGDSHSLFWRLQALAIWSSPISRHTVNWQRW